MDIKDIQNLIKFVAKSGANEVKLEMEDVKITIKTGSETTEVTYTQAAPVQAIPQISQAAPVAATNEAPAAPAASGAMPSSSPAVAPMVSLDEGDDDLPF